jgi:two-component system, OmpR family, KDP operon response regulator KdpE
VTSDRILAVDDDPLILRLVRLHLEKAGYSVLTALDGVSALDLIAAEQPDLVVLDLTLPKLDGYAVCQAVREFSTVPIVMLTARGEQVDKLRGFEAGADDFITKPFAPAELLARVQAVLRRSRQPARSGSAVIQCGRISIDAVRRRVRLGDEEVKLTPTEYRLLLLLAQQRDRVMTHRDLLVEVWGPEYADDRGYLWAYMRRLRRKLEANPESPVYLLSEAGTGYWLRSDAADA